MKTTPDLMTIYRMLLHHFGHQNWWPAQPNILPAGLPAGKINYQDLQLFMHKNVNNNLDLYQDYHAQLVALGSVCCQKNKTHCVLCPLVHICNYLE